MSSPPEPKALPPKVRYRDGEPDFIEIKTRRWASEYSYTQRYTFDVDNGTAVLKSLEADNDSYPVQANAGTRTAAREAVLDLPFVDEVVMFDD